jgi:hypothetical protein
MLNMGDALFEAELRQKEASRTGQRRLVPQAPTRDLSRAEQYRHGLIWLGTRMEAWGCRLQTRYAVESHGNS